jgi:hypothetical protein
VKALENGSVLINELWLDDTIERGLLADTKDVRFFYP